MTEKDPNAPQWPPPPSAPPRRAADRGPDTEHAGALFPGAGVGCLLFVAAVVGGLILVMVGGTLILGPSKYGQTSYPPVLPYPVLDALYFVGGHLPAVLLFLRLRRRRRWFAWGLLSGSPLGMLLLTWLWEAVLPATMPRWYGD